MTRWALGLRYDGSAYYGWQTQPGFRTIQGTVEQALSQVANQKTQVVCAGRTDKGVHAVGQVIHFDTDSERKDSIWVSGANHFLPPDISVIWAKTVKNDFHARFNASSRSYRYIIFNEPQRPAIFKPAVFWYRRPLQENLMHEGIQYLLGEHDFSSFRGADCCAKTTTRNMYSASVRREGNLILIDVQATAFLMHMVRYIVAALIEVGLSLVPPQWVKHLLDAKDRALLKKIVPPHGLYLMNVSYPEHCRLHHTQDGIFFIN